MEAHMPYPDHFSAARYNAVWDSPDADDRAEADILADAFFAHGIPLVTALEGAEFSDVALNDMCHELAKLLDAKMAEIKRRGDL